MAAERVSIFPAASLVPVLSILLLCNSASVQASDVPKSPVAAVANVDSAGQKSAGAGHGDKKRTLALLASGAVESALKGESGTQPLTGSLGFLFTSDPDAKSTSKLHESLRGLVSVAANSSTALSGGKETFLQALLSDSPNQPGIVNSVSLDYDRDWEYGNVNQSYGYRVFASSGVETWQALVGDTLVSSPETITRFGVRGRWTMIHIEPKEDDKNDFAATIEAGVAYHWVGSEDDQAIAVRRSALASEEWMYPSMDLGLEIAVRQLRAVVNLPFLATGPARDRTTRNSVQFILEAPLLSVSRSSGE